MALCLVIRSNRQRFPTVPNFKDSVSNAFDFASTAIDLYRRNDPNVVNIANILFGAGVGPVAIGESTLSRLEI